MNSIILRDSPEATLDSKPIWMWWGKLARSSAISIDVMIALPFSLAFTRTIYWSRSICFRKPQPKQHFSFRSKYSTQKSLSNHWVRQIETAGGNSPTASDILLQSLSIDFPNLQSVVTSKFSELYFPAVAVLHQRAKEWFIPKTPLISDSWATFNLWTKYSNNYK